MTDEKLTPERAVRLLRAKAGELEAQVLDDHGRRTRGLGKEYKYLAADIALIAQLVADHMEGSNASQVLYEAHVENLIERVYVLEERVGQIDADLWTRLDALERYALADAEHGVRGDPESMPPLVKARRELLDHHQQQRRSWPQQQYPKPTWPVENQPQQGDTQ